MKHTCDTARSGSEKGNNCAACLREPIRRSIPTGLGDVTGEWERQTSGLGKKTNPGRLASDALEDP